MRFFLLLPLCFLTGHSFGKAEKSLSKNFEGFEGVWKGDCLVDGLTSSQRTLSFKGAQVVSTLAHHNGTECAPEKKQETLRKVYLFSKSSRKAKLVAKEAFFTAHTEIEAKALSDIGFCGFSDWAENREKKVTNLKRCLNFSSGVEKVMNFFTDGKTASFSDFEGSFSKQ